MIPVIIPFYKNKAQLDKCLLHLKHQSMPVEVFIRDNSEDNIYFTAAINEGIRHFLKGPAKYMILLNQDMYLEKYAVEEMVHFMNRNPRCGIGAPLQLHSKQHDYVIWAGCFEAFPVGRHLHGPLHRFRNDEPIYWANGACMILRREMVEEIGLLDKNMAFIGSDSDYSLTARARGWEIWRIASAKGVHEHGASGISDNPRIELLKVQDMIRFAQKWLTGDQYRKLTYEGPELTLERIDETMNKLMQAEKNLYSAIDLDQQKLEGTQSCASR
jgi:GT2 family glycosyltransferase